MALGSVLMATSVGVAHAAPPAPQGLDTGSYSTEARMPLGVAGSPEAGAGLEGQRMADFVVGPWEVDPRLIETVNDGAVVIDSPDTVADVMSPEFTEVINRHALVTGFSSSRADEDHQLLVGGVLRFDDQTEAIAGELGDAAARTGTVVSIPGHPEAHAYTDTYTDHDGLVWTVVRSLTAHGPYVVFERAAVRRDTAGALDASIALVTGVLDRQLPLIDQFQPTPVDALALLPADRSGLLARAVPANPADVSGTVPGTYGPRAALHFEENPLTSAGLFDATGVSVVTSDGTDVYETVDAPSAQRLAEGLGDQLVDEGVATPQQPVPALPASRCLRVADPDYPGPAEFFCGATASRYAITAVADDLRDAQQRLAAQSVLLSGV